MGSGWKERLKAASNGGPNRARSAIIQLWLGCGRCGGLDRGAGEEERKKIPAWSLHRLRAGPFRVSPGPAGLTAAAGEGKTPRQTRQPHLQLNPHFLSCLTLGSHLIYTTPRRKKGRAASIAIRSSCKASFQIGTRCSTVTCPTYLIRSYNDSFDIARVLPIYANARLYYAWRTIQKARRLTLFAGRIEVVGYENPFIF